MKLVLKITLLIFSLSLVGCSTNKKQDISGIYEVDKYENYNRKVYKFNEKFEKNVGRPAGKAYKKVFPEPVRYGISNFFSNLKMPLNILNAMLQGEVEGTLNDLMRFSINTVFGLGGFLDIATPAGLEHQPRDFGQTLFKWGVWKQSNFVMVPFFGGSNFRDISGGLAMYPVDPTYKYIIQTGFDGRLIIYTLDAFNTYTKVMELTDTLQEAIDPYALYRLTLIQYRNKVLHDGNPPLADLDDFDFD